MKANNELCHGGRTKITLTKIAGSTIGSVMSFQG